MGKQTIREQLLSDAETEGETHLRHFFQAVEAGETPQAGTMEFIAEALRNIYGGGDPKKALKISGKKGRPADINAEIRHALMVENLILEGRGQDEARGIVAVTETKFKTIRRHHKKHKQLAKAVIKMHGGNTVNLDEIKVTLLGDDLKNEASRKGKK